MSEAQQPPSPVAPLPWHQNTMNIKPYEVLQKEHDGLVAERDALRVEYESRAIWIKEMNDILGYNNSDGFHSVPDPHEIARGLVARVALLEHNDSRGREELVKLRQERTALLEAARVVVHANESGDPWEVVVMLEKAIALVEGTP